jgi:hypothetical protein
MMTKNLWPASFVALVLAACSNQGSAPTAPVAASTPTRTLATTAMKVHGDLAPSRLVAIAVPRASEAATIYGSDPAAPKKAFTLESVPELTTRRDFSRLVTSADAASLTFPIDAPAGARVVVRGAGRTVNLHSVHMHHVASGIRLDHARDAASSAITVRHVPNAESVASLKASAAKGSTLTPVRGENPGLPAGGGAIAREPGFEMLSLPNRTLSIDEPMTPGHVQLDIPAELAAAGIIVDVQQPNSPITLTGATRELQYGFGDIAEVAVSLANAGAAIDGATITGEVQLPNGTRVPGLTFTSTGAGNYVAHIPLASADTKFIGAWVVNVKATGTSNGAPFERDLETAFGYSPAHAQMVSVATPAIVRGADGMIDEVTIDVDVETLVDDRFCLRGTLVYKDAAGDEHAIAIAQTGQTLAAGTTTMKLHFAAKDLALAKIDGPYTVRDLALVSDGFATTQHRLGRGLDLVTPSIRATEIRFPTVLSAAAQDMVDLGLF